MPIYDYKCVNKACKQCGRVWELLLKASAVPKCGECGEDLQKQISKAGIKIKGGASPRRYG